MVTSTGRVMLPTGTTWIVPCRCCICACVPCRSARHRVDLYTYSIMTTGCDAIQEVLAAVGGSFCHLEPVTQALLQATATGYVQSGGMVSNDPVMLQLIKTVPLMHAEDYISLIMGYNTGKCL